MTDKKDSTSGQSSINSSIMSMLESLADALDSKCEEIENSGTSASDDIRVTSLKDVSDAIKKRFLS